jgi:membrane glycosyltransferase
MIMMLLNLNKYKYSLIFISIIFTLYVIMALYSFLGLCGRYGYDWCILCLAMLVYCPIIFSLLTTFIYFFVPHSNPSNNSKSSNNYKNNYNYKNNA